MSVKPNVGVYFTHKTLSLTKLKEILNRMEDPPPCRTYLKGFEMGLVQIREWGEIEYLIYENTGEEPQWSMVIKLEDTHEFLLNRAAA